MNRISDIEPIIAWDGGRRIAAAFPEAPAGASLSIIAHGPEVSACIAVAEAAAGPVVALLPQHARHLDLTIATADGAKDVIAVELDPQLAPAMADTAQPGLRTVLLDVEAGLLRLATGQHPAGTVALNLTSSGSGGRRMTVGPLIDLTSDRTVTTVRIAPEAETLRLDLVRPGGGSPVLAAHIPADAADLAGLPDDVTGASGASCAARGFRLSAPEAADGRAHFLIRPFKAGDTVLLLSPRHHRITLDAGRRPGTRLTLVRAADGTISVDLATHAYRPATSTALAALGGGSTAAGENPQEDAPALAEAWWKRSRETGVGASAHLEDLAAMARPSAQHPLAALTRAALAQADAGASPLVAAVAVALGLPPALVEEIEALSATDRAALAAWTALDPPTAAAACRQRIILPPPAGADVRVTAATVAAMDTPELRAQLRDLADRLDPRASGAEDRRRLEDIRGLGDPQRTYWITPEAADAVLDALRRNPAPVPKLSPVARLVAVIKQDETAWTAAQKLGRDADLGAVAERRALIPIAASGAGLAQDILDDLDSGLMALSAAEVLLLHNHLENLSRRQALLRSVKQAVMLLDDAAGARGMSARIDRTGDPLVGMTRIGSASEPVVRQLVGMPQARDALVALMTWINAFVPAQDLRDGTAEQLVRNLKSYSCFLLMHAITAECRAMLGDGSPGAAALAARLNSGLAETLPRFAAAAAARTGEDLKLGLAFTARLPVIQEQAAS